MASFAAAPPGAAAAASLSVQVSVRDLTLTIECGSGLQTLKWMAMTACAQYAAVHAAAGSAAFTPVLLSDAEGNALYPADIVCERLQSGDTVKMDIIGPKLGLQSSEFKREKTLWEHFAFSNPATSLVPIVFLFDASELALSSPPALFGNFNSWRTPMPMSWWQGNLYKLTLTFPAGCEIVWTFVVAGQTVLTPAVYPLVHDARGNKMHYLQVSPLPPSASLDAGGFVGVSGGAAASSASPASSPSSSSPPPLNGSPSYTLASIIASNQLSQARWVASQKLSRNGRELPVLSAKVTGVFPGSRKISMLPPRAEMARLEARDWAVLEGGLGEIYPRSVSGYAAGVHALRDSFLKHHAELVSLFRFYAHSSSVASNVAAGGEGSWNSVQWVAFLELLGVVSPAATEGNKAGGALTPARADRIYHRAVFGSASTPSNDGSATGTGSKYLHTVEDVFSPRCVLSRSAFVAALLRVAMLLYPNPLRREDWVVPPPAPKEEAAAGGSKDGTVPVPVRVPVAVYAPPPRGESPNPSLSLDLFVELVLEPFASESARANSWVYRSGNGPSAGAGGLSRAQSIHPSIHIPGASSSASTASSAAGGRAAQSPSLVLLMKLRHDLLSDAGVQGILAAESSNLRALFEHYTGGLGAGAGGGEFGGIGGVGSAAAGGASALSGGLGGGGPSALSSPRPVRPQGSTGGSPSIHLRELDLFLTDYTLLDPLVPRGRWMSLLGLRVDQADGPAEGAAEAEGATELLYPEWIELLVRIAGTGSQWSNLYVEQERLIAEAIANGTLNPLDKPPASMMLAGSGSAAGVLDDDVDESTARRPDETTLAERLVRLVHWLFPSEKEQHERRAKLAAQQVASVAPVAVAPKKVEVKEEVKEEAPKLDTAKAGAKGKAAPAASKPTPAKKAPAAAKK